MKTEKKFDFKMNSLVFCIVGFLIPGFTAIILLGIQMLFTKLGIECSNAWKVIWIIGWIGSIILPLYFTKYIRIVTAEKLHSLKSKFIFFNLLEYIFIQISGASLLTNGKTLCYVTDGQNGIELAFSGWLSLPIIFMMSFYFSKISKLDE